MVKIMSFNIRTASASDGRNGWEYRKQLVVERIRAFSPDLSGVQECRNDAQAEFMKSSLPDYFFIGFERGGGDDTTIEMAPIFIKRSSFEILDAGCFWLSETPEIPGSISWGSAFPRTVTWAKLKGLGGRDESLYFFNTHFDYANLQVQVESARLLSRRIAQLENHPPVVLCGDFNVEKESIPYQILSASHSGSSAGMQDSCRTANPAPWQDEGTFHDFGRLQKPQVLDWILTSSHFRPVEASVDRTQRGDIYPSDHYPLGCVLSDEPG